jgi:hypothetical protein
VAASSWLDHSRAIQQIISLERRAAHGGRDSVDHPPGQHDDVSNSIAGFVACLKGGYRYDALNRGGWLDGPDDPPRQATTGRHELGVPVIAWP